MHGAAAGLCDLGRITGKQHLAEVQHEVGYIRRHYCRRWCVPERDLHEGVLHRHRRDTEHTGNDREGRVGVAPRTRGNTEYEKGHEERQLQQQQRPQRRNLKPLEAAGKQTLSNSTSMKTGTDRM